MSALTKRARCSVTSDNRGVALIEFALVAPIRVLLLANVVEFGRLIWSQMQLDYAAQTGAQMVLKVCANQGNLPATTNCPNMNSAVVQAVQSGPLGASATVSSGYPSESYECTSGINLVSVGTPAAPPSPFDCSSVGNPGAIPGDYVQIDVSYSYSPVFTQLSLASPQTRRGQALERMQ